MVKEGLMKKLLVLSLVFACMTGNAQVSADSVVMTVAGKQIPLDEFIFIAQKNSEVNLSDRKSVNAYVELFKNFKLKWRKRKIWDWTRRKRSKMNWIAIGLN